MAKIFVGSLPQTMDEATFQQLFAPHGNITSLVCSPQKRFGLVNYSTPEEAQTAINATNGMSIGGSMIVVKMADNQGYANPAAPQAQAQATARPVTQTWMPAGQDGGLMSQDRLYVKGMPPGMGDEDVRSIFSGYGTVVDTKVLVANGKSNDGQGQSVAIIKMANAAEAAWLIENVNGNIPQGLTTPVQLSYANSQKSGDQGARYAPYAQAAQQAPAQQAYGAPRSGGPGSESLLPGMQDMLRQAGSSSALYIKGLPMTADDLYLYRAFSPFGCILSVKAIPKDNYVIGFVHYASDEEAATAIAGLNGQTLIDGSTLNVSVKVAKA